MQAIEFETYVNNGIIKIPSIYKNIENQKAKVIILFPVEINMSNFSKEKLKDAFKKAQAKNVFKSVTDSKTWQKEIRDEWE